jgi:TPR repeat protein
MVASGGARKANDGRWAASLHARFGRMVRAAALAVLVPAFWAAPAGSADIADGFAAYQAGQYEQARDIWLILAEGGDPVAQYNLGKLFEFGGGDLRQDYVQAARWYREAAAQGVAAASNNLGLMHAQGRGVPRDTARAAELWQMAAADGYALAQYNLGLAYFRGEGIRQDEAQAAGWFRRAAEGGLADAQYAMGQMSRTGRVVPQDEAEALAWYRLAAAQGHDKAALEAVNLEDRGVVASRPEPALEVKVAATEAAPASDQPAMPPPPGEAVVEVRPAAELPIPPAPGETEAGSNGAATSQVANGQVEAAGAQDQPLESEVLPDSVAEAAVVEIVPTEATEPAVELAAVSEAPEASPAPVAAVLDPEGYRVWLLSADSPEAAEELRQAALDRHEAVLASIDMTIHEVDYGELGHYYRVLAGPLESREVALDLCRRLRLDTPDAFCKILKQ